MILGLIMVISQANEIGTYYVKSALKGIWAGEEN